MVRYAALSHPTSYAFPKEQSHWIRFQVRTMAIFFRTVVRLRGNDEEGLAMPVDNHQIETWRHKCNHTSLFNRTAARHAPGGRRCRRKR